MNELCQVLFAWFSLLVISLIVIEIVCALDRLTWRLYRAVGWILYTLYAPVEWLCTTILRWTLFLGLFVYWYMIFVNSREFRGFIEALGPVIERRV